MIKKYLKKDIYLQKKQKVTDELRLTYNNIENIKRNRYKSLCPSGNSINSRQCNTLEQLKSSFERSINWNKYQSKETIQQPKTYLDYLIHPSFQEVNKFFVLSFENTTDTIMYTGYYLPKVEIKNYNVLIYGKTFLISQLKIV